MDKTHKRNIFRASKYQAPILNLVIGLAIITLIMVTVNIAFFSYDAMNIITNPDRAAVTLKLTIALSLIILPAILLIGIFWAYRVTSQLIGAFERIIRELDGVLEQKQKKHITIRKGDILAQEVVQRINTLIDRMS